MTDIKYIVNKGYDLTVKGGSVTAGYIFGIDEITGNKQQGTIDFLLEKKVIKQLEPKPKQKPVQKTRGRGKSKK